MGELTARVGLPRPWPTVGVMGRSGSELSKDLRWRCRKLGAAIARAGCTLINEACRKDAGAHVIYDDDPERLVVSLLALWSVAGRDPQLAGGVPWT